MLEEKEYQDSAINKAAKVLVVDDEPIIVKRLKTLLETLGYVVSAFTDSEAALEKIGNEQFDLIITDLKMRKNDGLKVLETVKQKDKNIPVIIITGFGNWECVTEAIKKGASGCISKPFKIEELQRAIDLFGDVRQHTAQFLVG